MTIGERYAAGRGRITDLVADLDRDAAATKVPACPDWTVHNVVSHLTGVCADILAGNIAGVATDPWTQAQVDARRDRDLASVLAEWAEVGPRCEELAAAFPPDAGEQWLADLTTHEHDLRGALGRPGERDGDAVRAAFAWMAGRLDQVARTEGRPGLRVITGEGDEVTIGDGATTVRAPRFDFMRAITGRRSSRQIEALDWDGDPVLWVFNTGPFHTADADVVE